MGEISAYLLEGSSTVAFFVYFIRGSSPPICSQCIESIFTVSEFSREKSTRTSKTSKRVYKLDSPLSGLLHGVSNLKILVRIRTRGVEDPHNEGEIWMHSPSISQLLRPWKEQRTSHRKRISTEVHPNFCSILNRNSILSLKQTITSLCNNPKTDIVSRSEDNQSSWLAITST